MPLSLYRRGALLVAGSTVVLSSAGFLARWAQTDPATTLFWRSVFATLSLALYLGWRERGRFRRPESLMIVFDECRDGDLRNVQDKLRIDPEQNGEDDKRSQRGHLTPFEIQNAGERPLLQRAEDDPAIQP